MRVVAAEHVADHARTLDRLGPARRSAEGQPHALHRVQDAALHGLLPIADIGQCAALDHRQGVFEVGPLGVMRQRDGVVVGGRGWFGGEEIEGHVGAAGPGWAGGAQFSEAEPRLQPVRIGRSASISSTMNSKNAFTRGVCRNSGVVSTRQMRANSGIGPSTRTSSGSASAIAVGSGRDANARLGRIEQSEHAAVARNDAAPRRHLPQPLGRAVLGHRLVKADQVVLVERLDALRPAAALDVLAAGVHGPDRIADLAPDQRVVVGVARAQRHVRVALGQVEVLVAHHELDTQSGVAGVEALDQRRLRDAVDDRLGAGDTDHAHRLAPRRFDLLLQRQHRAADLFGLRQQRLAELGQPIAAGVALDQRLADAPFELGQPALHGRLVDLQRAAGRDGAAVARDGEKHLEIVPIEHRGRCARCCTCGYAVLRLGLAGLRVTQRDCAD